MYGVDTVLLEFRHRGRHDNIYVRVATEGLHERTTSSRHEWICLGLVVDKHLDGLVDLNLSYAYPSRPATLVRKGVLIVRRTCAPPLHGSE
ncbi:hypothetical protein MRB53_039020 [Persea americana]|nr:hypothetical protein MRB53_039020 [Persea americana]